MTTYRVFFQVLRIRQWPKRKQLCPYDTNQLKAEMSFSYRVFHRVSWYTLNVSIRPNTIPISVKKFKERKRTFVTLRRLQYKIPLILDRKENIVKWTYLLKSKKKIWSTLMLKWYGWEISGESQELLQIRSYHTEPQDCCRSVVLSRETWPPPSQGYLAVSGDIFVCHNWRGGCHLPKPRIPHVI